MGIRRDDPDARLFEATYTNGHRKKVITFLASIHSTPQQLDGIGRNRLSHATDIREDHWQLINEIVVIDDTPKPIPPVMTIREKIQLNVTPIYKRTMNYEELWGFADTDYPLR